MKSEEAAYIIPFAVFLLFVSAGSRWPSLYPVFYLARTVVVAALLIRLWPRYTVVRWSHWKLGVLAGIAGVVQWIDMQLWLQHHFDYFKPSSGFFNPVAAFPSHAWLISFFAVRLAGATLVVPVMEELFWRDYLWRLIIVPQDFRRVRVGQWSLGAFLIVAVAFSTVHGNWWLTAIVWAMIIGGLLAYTRSLGACIIAHAVTNLLLGMYVIHTGDWSFW